MNTVHGRHAWLLMSLVGIVGLSGSSSADETTREPRTESSSPVWQEKAVEYAQIMSRVKWTPVVDGMPKRAGFFEKGTEYTGIPYSSVKAEGRYIGFDIFLKTFLAAVENPQSVLYTENLSGKVTNAECYYGAVCSSYTSYALQCGNWYVSRLHGPPFRDGISLVEPQSAQFAKAGDLIYTPPSTPSGGSHIELVTGITKNRDGKVTHVRVEDSWPQTTREINRSANKFNSHIAARGRELYRITNLDAWRENNKAESFLFPNYDDDSATPVINRVLLLDRGDWVAYHKGQPVKFNVIDKDALGVKSLVIKRGDTVVEEINHPGKGVIERSFETCADYTAHCVMQDGSLSEACEFSVCDLDFSMPAEQVSKRKPWEIKFSAVNMKVIIVYLKNETNGYDEHNVFVSEQDQQNGKIVIPADLIQDAGKVQVWLIGENRYGRLKKRQDIVVND